MNKLDYIDLFESTVSGAGFEEHQRHTEGMGLNRMANAITARRGELTPTQQQFAGQMTRIIRGDVQFSRKSGPGFFSTRRCRGL